MTQKEKNRTKLKIAVQMDSLDKINKKTDSTLALIEEAHKRNYIVFVYTVDNLSLVKNKPVACGKEVLEVNIKNEKFLSLKNSTLENLENFDVILIRQDPPFDMQYITATYILDKISSSCLILNNPASIRNCPEKIFVMDFYHLMPPTIISREYKKIISFIKKHKNIVFKPLFGNGGKDVYFLNEKDPNLNIIIENMLINREHAIAQKFIKKVNLGDKRILLLNGKPVGAVNRIPNKNEIRANLHIGGIAKKTSLSKRDFIICNEISHKLKEKGLFFSGIDIIDGYLTEINVTSPTCIREIDKLNKTNISKLFWDEVVKIN
ncbi:glutathione synthase [Pelagibacteraceae bacterium]|nr:glutathione synthase [Pelagibacteraceae bacterium]